MIHNNGYYLHYWRELIIPPRCCVNVELRGAVVRRTLSSHFQDLEIVDYHEAHSGDTFMEFHAESSALNFLQEFADDYLDMMTLRNILEDHLFNPNLSRLNDQMVLEQVAWLLVSGRIKIAAAPLPPEIPSTGGTAPPAEEEEEEEEEEVASIAEVAPEPDWITFRVVEDGSGKPVSGVTLKVKLPSGEVWDFTTDGDGKIEIKDVPSGTCTILKMSDADALEVVQVS